MSDNDDDEKDMSPQELDWHDYTCHPEAWNAAIDPSKERPDKPVGSPKPSGASAPSNSDSFDCFTAALMILLGLVIFGMLCFFAFYKM